MLKQSFSKAKKVLTILLAVLFVASLTVEAASAFNSHGHHSCDSYSSYGSPHSHTCGCSHSHACGCSNSHTCGCSPCHCNDDKACENDE